MADFRIQRFKHTWKSAWNSQATYNADDVVSLGGKVYNCLVRHVSSTDFYQDLDFENTDAPPVSVPRWELMADGVSLRGEWQTNRNYLIGDIVKNGAISFICLVNHVSSLSELEFVTDYLEENYWTVLLESSRWNNEWELEFSYKIGDVIKYFGKIYRCVENHTSADTLEDGLLVDIDKWQILTIGNAWLADWQPDSVYFERDVIRYGGIVYRCVAQHTSKDIVGGLELNVDDWEIVIEGIDYKNTWIAGARYKQNDVVRNGSYLYKANIGHTTETSDLFNAFLWNIYCPGQEYAETWNSLSIYGPGEIVTHGGYLFVAETTNVNSVPDYDFISTNPDWLVLFKGTKIQGDWDNTSTYQVGDLVRRNGQLYVAKKNVPVNEDTDVLGDGSSVNSEYWDLLIPGTNWTGNWQERRTYLIGDLVLWKGATYKCLVKNFSTTLNRPDNYTDNEWEQFTYGDPNNQLSFVGDLKYYGTVNNGNGQQATNLSIGSDAQTLQAIDNQPSWSNFNSSSQVYFVGLDGVDRPDRGSTSTASWRTIRYALEHMQGPATLFVRTGKFEEVLPLKVPADVAVVGDELRSTVVTPVSELFSALEISIFQSWVDYLSLIVENILFKESIDPVLGEGFQVFDGGDISQTFTVISVPNPDTEIGGAVYQINSVIKPVLEFVRGGVYTFDQSDASNVTHQIAFKDGAGDSYTQGVITIGLVGEPGAQTVITVANDAPDDLRYYCVTHGNNMGNTITVEDRDRESQLTAIRTNLSIMQSTMSVKSGIQIISTNTKTVNIDAVAAIELLENNLEFLQEEIIGFFKENYPLYSIDNNKSNAIVERMLSAMIYDIKFPGIYQAIETGRYFYNASHANENKKSNMFLFSNGSGLRNMTLTGLSGELGGFNEFLTQRPTAGAYASLNPGWGTADHTVWINTKSPYVQNVTTFGTGCVGLKIDGALHDGGNKSIVSNDFTQILSDGIGIWCNKDGLTEAVSVFSYYNHISYLCTDGGKIRGTNGNSSYGKFGAVAEKFNPDEIPIPGEVNNRFFNATVDQVFSNNGKIIKLFFDHSGQNYTDVTYSLIGAGINAVLLGDEFRDQAISESRVFAPGDSSSPGGSGYTLLINNAQIGDRSSITLAGATDDVPDTFRGLRIAIETGTGSGQYGYIVDYDNSSKIALVGNEFYEPYQITEALSQSLTVEDSVEGLKTNDAVCFTGDIPNGLFSNTVYYINNVDNTGISLRASLNPVSLTGSFIKNQDSITATVVTEDPHDLTSGNVVFIPNATEGTQFVLGNGWDRTEFVANYFSTVTSSQYIYQVTFNNHGLVDGENYFISFKQLSVDTSGSPQITVVDQNTIRFQFSGNLLPGQDETTLVAIIRFGARSDSGQYTVTVVDQNTFTVETLDSLYSIGTVGFSTNVEFTSTPDNDLFMYKLGWTSYQPGTAIPAILDTTTSYRIEPRVIFSKPDTSQTSQSLGNNANWSDIAFGNDVFVAISGSPGAASDVFSYSETGSTWNTVSVVFAEWSRIKFGNGLFVVVSKDGKSATSVDGIAWIESLVPELEYTSLVYGNGTWIAVAGGTDRAIKSSNGIDWVEFSIGEGADWSDIVYGKGRFIAVALGDSSSADRAYSTDNGLSWTIGSFGSGVKSIVYGNNRFVAVSGGYAGASDVYISFDGENWTLGDIIPADWQRIAYGQGKFVAVAYGTDYVVESVDGLDWRTVSIASSKNHTSVIFGNPNQSPKFITVAENDSDALIIVRGTRAQGRLRAASGRGQGISLWEQGSGYSTTPLVTVFDPNNSTDAVFENRVNNGVIGNPSIVNPGLGWVSLSSRSTITGNGFADRYQLGNKLVVRHVTRVPGPGSNLLISGINKFIYRVLSTTVLGGEPGDFELELTITKPLQLDESPDHLTEILIREQYSQVRISGHDFLDIGLGNFEQANYPNTLFPQGTVPAPQDETKESDGGRVFYTSTDQDGNFRVGELFAVEQSTGTVTISAEFFKLEGLEEISIGGVSVGGTGVVVREFSTDPLFIADSNNVIPTQKAIREFISRRVSGGGSDAFTGQFTAGIVSVGPNVITTVTNETINIPVKVAFNAPISGSMLINSYFLAGTGFVEEDPFIDNK